MTYVECRVRQPKKKLAEQPARPKKSIGESPTDFSRIHEQRTQESNVNINIKSKIRKQMNELSNEELSEIERANNESKKHDICNMFSNLWNNRQDDIYYPQRKGAS